MMEKDDLEARLVYELKSQGNSQAVKDAPLVYRKDAS